VWAGRFLRPTANNWLSGRRVAVPTFGWWKISKLFDCDQLFLVADLSQKVGPRPDFLWPFDSLGSAAIDHAEYASTLFAAGDDHFHRVGGGAEDGAHFGHIANDVQHIDGESVPQQQDKNVSGGESLRVDNRRGAQFLVVTFAARQARPGTLVEGQPEPGLRRRRDHG